MCFPASWPVFPPGISEATSKITPKMKKTEIDPPPGDLTGENDLPHRQASPSASPQKPDKDLAAAKRGDDRPSRRHITPRPGQPRIQNRVQNGPRSVSVRVAPAILVRPSVRGASRWSVRSVRGPPAGPSGPSAAPFGGQSVRPRPWVLRAIC